MGRFSPNYGPPQPIYRTSLAEHLANAAQGVVGALMQHRMLQRQQTQDLASLYAQGFRPEAQASAEMTRAAPVASRPSVGGTEWPTFDHVAPNGPTPAPAGDSGYGFRAPSLGAVPEVDTRSVDRAITGANDFSTYFGDVDARNAMLRSRPTLTVGKQSLVFSPEARANEANAPYDARLAGTLHAIALMRGSGDLSAPQARDATLEAHGITPPSRLRTPVSFDQMIALEALRQQDRLDAIRETGDQQRQTRTVAPARAPATGPAKPAPLSARDRFLQQRYNDLLQDKDRYGNPTYDNPDDAYAEAVRQTNLQYPPTPTPRPRAPLVPDSTRANRIGTSRGY